MRTVLPSSNSPYKFAHVVIRTRQLPAMRDHYVKLLNARVVTESPFHCGLTYDEEHHRLALVALPEVENEEAEPAGSFSVGLINDNQDTDLGDLAFPSTTGVDHLAYTYSSLEGLLGNYVRLRDLGVAPSFCINHGITVGLYYTDPDGIKNELQIDSMTVEAADEYLQSPEGLANVIGYPFDPEDLLRRYQAGEPVRELALNIGKPQAVSA